MPDENGRPGVMFYFDLLPILELLSDAQAGALFKAAFVYAKNGVLPEFEDNMVKLSWASIQGRLDQDAKNYEKKRLKRVWSRYCGIEKNAGRVPLEYDEWLDWRQTSTCVNKCQQTSPTTTTSTATSTTTSTATSTTTSTATAPATAPAIPQPRTEAERQMNNARRKQDLIDSLLEYKG